MTERLPIPDPHLEVRLNGVLAGRLWHSQRRLVFGYDADWLHKKPQPMVSQSLPPQSDPHDGPEVEAFFGNLLPEGDMRTAVARALQISERNDYALLDALGGDCAGALMLTRPGAPVIEPETGGSLLTRKQLAALVEELPRRPLLAGENGLRLSLAGAQAKLALCDSGNHWMSPAPGAISTCILKPPIRDLPGSIENEAFCMTLAARCGLGVPECWIERDPDLYVVRRYDRFRDPESGRVKRLHQEDFCQALGIPSSNKYEAEGGPSLKDCFDLVRRVSSDPAGDLLRLLDWVIFNFMIGNHDAHAKNLSLLYGKGQVQLAPFYDLLSTATYQNLSEKFAMRIGGAESARYMSMRHWRQLATDCGLQVSFVQARFERIGNRIGDEAEAVLKDFESSLPSLEPIARALAARNEKFRHMIEADAKLRASPPG